jgi:hypothetical protein
MNGAIGRQEQRPPHYPGHRSRDGGHRRDIRGSTPATMPLIHGRQIRLYLVTIPREQHECDLSGLPQS